MGKIIITVALLAGAGAAGWYFFVREEPPKPAEVITGEARKQTVVEKVRAIGHVEPVTQVRVSANVTGDLLHLPVREGQTVKKGALLAEIDRERLVAVVRQSEANLRSAEAEVSLLRTQLIQAQSELDRTRGLSAKGLATPAELEKAGAEVEMVRAREESAKQRAAQAKAALDEATDHMAKTRIFAPIDGTIIALNKKVGERIRGSDLGEDVLLTLAPLHAMQVEVDVSEQDVVRLAVAQRAEITVDALKKSTSVAAPAASPGAPSGPASTGLPGSSSGRVVEIANSAIINNRGTEAETTTFRVKVALDAIPEGLRSGMSASVAIVTRVHDDTLAVPIEAVTTRLPSQLERRAGDKKRGKKGGMFDKEDDKRPDPIARREKPLEVVFVVSDGKVEPVKVKSGISSDLEVEILEGLDPGQQIVIGPYKVLAKELEPGSAVKVLRKLEAEPKRSGTELSER